jgi:hypothetical protein
MGILVIIYSKDSTLGGLDPIALETLITSFLALLLACKVGIRLSLSNSFFFFLLLNCKGAYPKEKCLRVLVLGLYACFGRELLLGNSLAYCLD